MAVQIRLRVSLVASILLVVVLATLVHLGTTRHFGSRAAMETAGTSFALLASRAKDQLDSQVLGISGLADFGASQAGIASVTGKAVPATLLRFMREALRVNPSVYSLYYGFDDGSFLQVIAVRGDARIKAAHDAPQDTSWIVRTITPGDAAAAARRQHWSFRNDGFIEFAERTDIAPAYDPRKRPWYGRALSSAAPALSDPYIYNSLQAPGLTISMRMPGGRGVFGVDLTLTQLAALLNALHVTDNGGVAIYDSEGRVLAASQAFGAHDQLETLDSMDSWPAEAVLNARRSADGSGLQRVRLNQEAFVAIEMWSAAGRDLSIAVVAPTGDYTGPYDSLQQYMLALSLLTLFIVVPVALVLSAGIVRNVKALAEDANRVANFNFSGPDPEPSRIVELNALADAFTSMKAGLADRTQALEISEQKLGRLVDLGIGMSSEHETDTLMNLILDGAKLITNADGGTLYTVTEDKELQFQIIRNDTLGIDIRAAVGDPDSMPPVPIWHEDRSANLQNVASNCVHQGRTINIDDAYNSEEFDFSGTKKFDEANGYRSKSFIAVPLNPRGGSTIGVLQLINARDPETGEICSFGAEVQGFVEALAAQAATALHNRELLDQQEALMDAMIQIIAGAIDAKSPYTGGHCERVPELAMMLAAVASDEKAGPLSDFSFETEDEWREFRIGAWLHDCGKVVTPEYVVDKATKLETIYNRIHEIRTRFEVLLRDAEIERLNAVAEGVDAADAQRAFEDRKRELEDDFAFVADSNVGGEFMEDSAIERLSRIGSRTWLRHFSDRVGLSNDEKRRCGGEPAALPAEERLLDDKPSHVIPRQGAGRDPYEGMGFKLPMPEHLYNQGEMYNLSIKRGTLTAEERFKINEHIMQTIAMLERLPFPKSLSRVPEYAGTHHETLIGTGYPRRLDASQLSVPARIMAIADIFEALTASDRPYKDAKTLSESVRILHFFKKDGHIDPDLFDLFLSSGVYKDYARRFLNPGQIDDVDIDAYLGAVSA